MIDRDSHDVPISFDGDGLQVDPHGANVPVASRRDPTGTRGNLVGVVAKHIATLKRDTRSIN
jgi:hypothetical protein